MSYSTIKYPASFAVLKPEMRKKAIEIANILIEEGLNRFTAEMIAMNNAREMARNLNSSINARIADCTIHVIPHPDGWAIVSQDLKKLYGSYISKKEAVIKGRSYAKTVKFKLFIHAEDGSIEDCESFVVNRPVTLSRERDSYPRTTIPS
jgi:hypothetical protein